MDSAARGVSAPRSSQRAPVLALAGTLLGTVVLIAGEAHQFNEPFIRAARQALIDHGLLFWNFAPGGFTAFWGTVAVIVTILASAGGQATRAFGIAGLAGTIVLSLGTLAVGLGLLANIGAMTGPNAIAHLFATGLWGLATWDMAESVNPGLNEH